VTEQQQQTQPVITETGPVVSTNMAADAQMLLRITAQQQRYLALSRFRDTLYAGKDYGVIPGTEKATLLLPGAQKLAILFELHGEPTIEEKEEDWTGERHGGEPFFRYIFRCVLHDDSGRMIGQSLAEINSWEAKYRWRWIPAHKLTSDMDITGKRRRISAIEEFEFAIQQKQTTGQYGKPLDYWKKFEAALADGTATRFPKKTRNGQTYNAIRIESVTYRFPNDDIYSVINTLMKIGQKRAFVGAVLTCTGASEFFTQDIEDMDEDTLESMGLRQPRVLDGDLDDLGGIEGDDKPLERQSRRPAPPAKSDKGDPKSEKGSEGRGQPSTPKSAGGVWTSGKGAKLIPELKKLTSMDASELLVKLGELGDRVNPDMTAETITKIVFDAIANTGAPAASGSTEPPPDDLPF